MLECYTMLLRLISHVDIHYDERCKFYFDLKGRITFALLNCLLGHDKISSITRISSIKERKMSVTAQDLSADKS